MCFKFDILVQYNVQVQDKRTRSIVYIDEWHRQGVTRETFPHPETPEMAKDGEQSTPQRAVSRDIKEN